MTQPCTFSSFYLKKLNKNSVLKENGKQCILIMKTAITRGQCFCSFPLRDVKSSHILDLNFYIFNQTQPFNKSKQLYQIFTTCRNRMCSVTYHLKQQHFKTCTSLNPRAIVHRSQEYRDCPCKGINTWNILKIAIRPSLQTALPFLT